MKITVTGNKLSANGKVYDCAIGKNGFAQNKIEGDNCTPIGTFKLREVLYRADKLLQPKTKLPISLIKKDDGWCDAPNDKNYNKKVKLPYEASHEKLWRDDNLYDVVIPIGYNDDPIVPGKGSAIFMHIAKPGYAGTEGCIALNIEDLFELLYNSDSKTEIEIKL